MKTYILAWCECTSDFETIDRYEPYHSLEAVQAGYNALVELETTYSANVCEVLESTDY